MINRVILIGNLGQDPEVRYTQSGSAVATLRVATSRSWKDKDGNKQEETEWHRVIAWAHTAEFSGKYLSKGSKVYVEGRLATRKWQDKDGKDQYTTEIIAATVQNLSPRYDQGGGGKEQEPPPYQNSTGEDVPF